MKRYYAGHNVTSPVAVFNNYFGVLESGYFDFAGGSANFPLVVVVDGAGKVQDLQGWSDELQDQLVNDLTKLTKPSHS